MLYFNHKKDPLRHLKAEWRDIWILLSEFGSPLLIFLLAIIGGGFAYYVLSSEAGEPLVTPLEGIYEVLTMTFLQDSGNFPHTWYLGIFHFVMPVIGLILIAQGVTEFSLMFFNRRSRGKEWETAVASTFNYHIVLVGLGHLGFRVAQELANSDLDIAVIELNPHSDQIHNVKELGIPVIQDDAIREQALQAAGIEKAKAIILCIQNDSLNLKVALKARKMNPDIQVIIRIFDDDFAYALQEQFGFTAFSATGMAAPAFAAAASGVDMTRPITIEGQPMSLAYIKVENESPLKAHMVSDIEQTYHLSVVFIRHDGSSDFHPSSSFKLSAQDVMAVLGGPGEIHALVTGNHPQG